uniref:tryptophan--tRNA ligase n=1 Tax=Helianthus annuus TaxID=4232 RepID=A0A251UIH3_HELAN
MYHQPTHSLVGHEIPKLLKYLLHFLGKKSSWVFMASKLKKLQIVMTSLILPTASLSTPPQSPISSSSSRIQHTLTQRIHIPPHIYKHPAAILLELCTSLQELHQIIPLIIKNGLYQEHLFQTKLVSLFCKYNSLTEATRVFEPIEDKNDALYHTMLKGYAQNSSISDGFSFFCRMSDLVPVGEDQKQHLELTRELAERVNHLYGGRKWKKLGGRGGLIFKVPEPLIPPAGARVMSLTDGLSKMSKSATSDLSRINLLDSKDAIANKIKRCKTDSFPGLEFDNPDRPECNNLLSIYQIITNKTKEEVAQECQSMNWGTFKPVLTDALIDHLQPIQARYEEIMSDTGYLDQILAEGASKAADIADVTVSNVYQAMGFLKRR